MFVFIVSFIEIGFIKTCQENPEDFRKKVKKCYKKDFLLPLMFFEILLAMAIGIFLGVISGVTPGIHINSICLLLLAFAHSFLSFFSSLSLAVILLSMAITHTFLDVIPSTFLGIPDDTSLSIFPAQKMVLEGRAIDAVALSTIGAFFGLLLSLLCVPFFLFLLPNVYSFVEPILGFILLGICILLLFLAQNTYWALFLFLLSGCFGLITLQLPMDQTLFPLLTGLFGIPLLLFAVLRDVKIPLQKKTRFSAQLSVFPILCGVFLGWIASFMPGLGTSQVASIGTLSFRFKEKEYLLLLGALSTVNMVLSLLSLYVLDKARNGAIVALSQFITLSPFSFLLLLCVSLIAGSVAVFFPFLFFPLFLRLFSRVSYRRICLCVFLFILSLVLFLSGFWGLFILFVGCMIGLIAETKNIPKSFMMGCLLIPTILYFLKI